jgi:dihydrolipoamide dehydrogenase
MTDEKYDAIVIGGGPGGYVCAIRLAQLGRKVACVEAGEVGGICLNWGCIPSKALISAAHLYQKARHAAPEGITCSGIELDVGRLQDHKDGIVKRLTGGVRTLLRGNGVRLLEGRAELEDGRRVRLTGRDGATRTIAADQGIVLATGSSTIELPGLPFDGTGVIGARDAVSLRSVPQRLLVVGGGVIGLELGMLYQSLGSELTIVELLPTLLSGIDRDCAKVVERRLGKLGAKIFTRTRAPGYERLPDGTLAVRLETPEGPSTVECDVVLVAVGMRPRSENLGLEALGVEVDARAFIRTDERCETSVPGLFAVGDVSGPPLLAHKASKEGEVCAEVIAGRAAAKDWVSIPAVVFTDPEIASAGLTEEQATLQGFSVRVGRFPFAALGRAMSLGETDGLVKAVSDAKSGRLLGMHIVGPSASDLISEAALALELGATVEDLSLTIHPHPTLSEALMEASSAALGHAIHVMNR